MATAWRDGVGDGSGKAMATLRQGWQRCGVEAKGGVDDGDDDGVASREATEAPREAALREAVSREATAQRVGNLGSLMAQ
jgi:hypothetical protein